MLLKKKQSSWSLEKSVNSYLHFSLENILEILKGATQIRPQMQRSKKSAREFPIGLYETFLKGRMGKCTFTRDINVYH